MLLTPVGLPPIVDPETGQRTERQAVSVQLLRVPGYPDILVLPDGRAIDGVQAIRTDYVLEEYVACTVEFVPAKEAEQ